MLSFCIVCLYHLCAVWLCAIVLIGPNVIMYYDISYCSYYRSVVWIYSQFYCIPYSGFILRTSPFFVKLLRSSYRSNVSYLNICLKFFKWIITLKHWNHGRNICPVVYNIVAFTLVLVFIEQEGHTSRFLL